MRTLIKRWYFSQYPYDLQGAEIKGTATFQGLFETLDEYGNVDEYLGVDDITLKERVLNKLAELMQVDESVLEDWKKSY